MRYNGQIIAFEGLDGCGKTTQLKLLAEALVAQGEEVVCTREPGGTAIGEELRDLLLNRPSIKWAPESELFAFIASMAQGWKEIIKPALIDGKTVLCDRFYLSTMAYQGYGRGFNVASIESALTNMFFPLTLPITHLILDMPLEKYHVPDGTDRFDFADFDFKLKAWVGYKRLAGKVENAYLIDGTGSIEEVHQRIMDILK